MDFGIAKVADCYNYIESSVAVADNGNSISDHMGIARTQTNCFGLSVVRLID